MKRWSRMPNWSSNASKATVRPGRSLCAVIRAVSSIFAIGLRATARKRRTCRRTYSCGYTVRSEAIGPPTDSLDDAMPVVENKESSGRRPDEQVLLGELSSQVQSALTKLSPELREAVILRDLQQLEYGEIQRVLSVPEGTVKSRINRGRIELARILQHMGVRPS